MFVGMTQKQKYCKHRFDAKRMCLLCGYIKRTKEFRPGEKRNKPFISKYRK